MKTTEASPRGPYCGMIGRLAPDGEAAFNVAIRTLTLRDGATIARLGLGSGIVADSSAGEEWRECLAKGAFVETARRFDLIETMRFDPQDGVIDLDRHLARMKASADALDFPFDQHETRNELQAATFRAGASRIRMMLSRTGALAIEMRPLEPAPDEPVGSHWRPCLSRPTISASATNQRPRLLRRGASGRRKRSRCCSAIPKAS